MRIEAQREIARERRKLAKRAQRQRKRVLPRPIKPQFRKAVLDERDRREKSALRARRRINGGLVDVAWRLSTFVADVWAAKVLLQAEFGDRGATPTRIARWLWSEERHGD